jgi:hypothetical protein
MPHCVSFCQPSLPDEDLSLDASEENILRFLKTLLDYFDTSRIE